MYLRILFGFVLSISLIGVTHAVDFDKDDHILKSGDINADGHLDYLWKGKDRFVIISGDIIVPLVISKPDVLLESRGGGQFEVIVNIPDSIANASLWQANTTPTFNANLNSDAYGDLVLLAQGAQHRGVVLYGGEDGQVSIGRYLDSQLIGSSEYANFDAVIISDLDGNGTDDLSFRQAGTTIAAAYSNGNNFSSINRGPAPEAFEVTSQWSHISQSNQDVFSPAPPNSAGISINRMATFTITDRPAIISNFAGSTWSANGDIEHDAAKTIVIIADSVNMTQPVKVLGSKADIVFITQSSAGDFTCNNCSFDGVYRISIVTQGSVSSIPSDTTQLGQFTAGPITTVTLNGLRAPKAIGLDVFTNAINPNPSIDLTQNVSILEDGLTGTADPIVEDENGALSVSSGSINLLLGGLTWGYHTNSIEASASSSSQEKAIDGTFRAKTIRIGSNESLVVNANAWTITDYASTVTYRGAIFVPDESVDYQSLAGDLTIKGTINSSGDVRYKAHGDIKIETAQDTMHGKNVKAVAGEKFSMENGFKLVATNIEIGAENVINSGSIQAINRLELFSRDAVLNQYGGEMFGAEIKIDSDGIVRNGSRTPYFESGIAEEPLNMSVDFLSNTDGLKTVAGTFYRMQLTSSVDVAAASPRVLAQNQKAHIAGSHISIKANSLENVNPYYLYVGQDSTLQPQRDNVNQVGIYAENSLAISAEEYILNSSALIFVNNRQGSLDLQAERIVNERYRVAQQLAYTYLSNVDDPESLITNPREWIIDETLETITRFYSPPGMVRSAGNFNAKSITDSDAHFSNNAGYVEVHGEARLAYPRLVNRGYVNQSMTRNSSAFINFSSPYSSVGSSVADTQSPIALDSRLYAGGGLFAPQSGVEFEQFSALDAKLSGLIEHLAHRDSLMGNLGAEFNPISEAAQFSRLAPELHRNLFTGCDYFTGGNCSGYWRHTYDLRVLDPEILFPDLAAAKQTNTISLSILATYEMDLHLAQMDSCYSGHQWGSDPIFQGHSIPLGDCADAPITVPNFSAISSRLESQVGVYDLFTELSAYYHLLAEELDYGSTERNWWN